MPRRTEPPVTDEQLRLALRQLWRPGWPDDLAAVLAHPVRGKCVRGMARQISRARPVAPVPVPRLGDPRAAVPPTPAAPAPRSKPGPGMYWPRRAQDMAAAPPVPAARRVLHQRGIGAWPPFDARRAAANDLGDD